MLSEIQEVQVIEDNGGDESTFLILVSGEKVYLDISSNHHHKIAQAVNQFLNIKS
ncbi:hypothetical protein NIES267_72020 (plasmid) [Calothrix parasitica NIES-267]|uniref:Uncharacterized protein n=1 Tax=Calothrix parasitica NIES-267 TaxID=1973488 RepID=A0A1Z4M2S4_9CYAN|nr:hypothetical protein NIES267_72020 [Calothrix parasitica NIES-267]